jgi:MoxR-like ATPase
MTLKELKEFLPEAFNLGITVMLHGPHGIGKSSAVKEWAKENGYEVVDRRLSQMESGDFLGLPDVSGETTQYKIPDWLPRDPNAKVIIFLDELNRGRRDVLQGIFQLALDRELGSYKLPKNSYVISAVNPNTDAYVVTDIFDKALIDRFCDIKFTPTAEEVFHFMAKDKSIDQDYIEFLKLNPAYLEDESLYNFSIDKRPSRRSNAMAGRISSLNLSTNVKIEAMAGLTGTTIAVAFNSFKSERTVRPLKGEEIVTDYQKYAGIIKKYAAVDNGESRHDILNVTADNVYDYILANWKNISDSETANVKTFIKDIPKDLAFSVLSKLAKSGTEDVEFMHKYVAEKLLNDEDTEFLLTDKHRAFIKEIESV